MKLYRVAIKYGRSPYTVSAYVEADTPKKAIASYVESEGGSLSENLAEGYRYMATLSELPEGFWQMKDYCRPTYIGA
jgi:hypothetical protein